MKDVTEYMYGKYRELAHDGRRDDGYMFPCGLIAFDLAFRLIDKSPELVHFRNVAPVRYGGRVSLGGHTVCVCEGKVYDPMVSAIPVPVELYSHVAFGELVVPYGRTDTDYIQDRMEEMKK